MKIVHVCLVGLFTDEWNYQDNLLSKYHKIMGNEVTVITSRYIHQENGDVYCPDFCYINRDGVKVIRLESYYGDSQTKIKLFKGLYESLEQEAPDVIFVHNLQFLNIYQIVMYARKHRVKIYCDNHSDFSNSGTNWLSRILLHRGLWHMCGRLVNPYTEKFYGVLPARVDFLTDVYGIPKEKCELLVMGADDAAVEAAAKPEVRQKIRAQYSLKEDDFVVMTGGKIDQWKTQTLLLMEAVQKIDRPDVKLIVFGSVTQELKDKVNALADGQKVQYIGWVQAKDSYQYFAAADLVVFPGRHSVFWEQVAAQGIPMFCKKWDGTTHIDLGGNVHFLTQDSVEEIQTGIEALLDDRTKYDHMKKIAVENGMREFSYKDIAKRSIEVEE